MIVFIFMSCRQRENRWMDVKISKTCRFVNVKRLGAGGAKRDVTLFGGYGVGTTTGFPECPHFKCCSPLALDLN